MIENKIYIVKSSGMPIMPVHPADVNTGNVTEMLSQIERPQKGDAITCLGKRKDDKHGWFYKVKTKDGEGWISGAALLKYEVEEI